MMEISGVEKASVLLMALGARKSAEVFKHLTEDEIEELSTVIVRMRDTDPRLVQRVKSEFELLTVCGAIGDTTGQRSSSRLSDRKPGSHSRRPFAFLYRAETATVCRVLSDEPSQVVAMVLRNLPPEKAASALALFSEDMQAEVAMSLCSSEVIEPEVITAIEDALEAKYNSVSERGNAAMGPEALVKILSRAGRSTERTLLDALMNQSPVLGREVRDMMFVFEDLARLDDRSIRLILHQADRHDLCMALYGADDALKARFFENMSERAVRDMKDEMESTGTVSIRGIELGQQRIADIGRQLIAQGMVASPHSHEEMVH
jgi:flagellar motor switch protein FliG